MSQDTQDMADASNGTDVNPSAGAPPSVLGQMVAPQMPNPQSRGSPDEQRTNDELSGDDLSRPSGGSRLMGILRAVAGVASTDLSAIPDKGSPSFITGLGAGTRSAQAAQATQQAIRFKTFDDQVRAATLHNQDLAMQNSTQDAQDRHEDHMNAMHAKDADWGIKYDSVANDGEAVMDHMRSQTAAYGSVSVPAGTHVSGDGKTL